MTSKNAHGIINFKIGSKLYTIVDDFEIEEGGYIYELVEGGINGPAGVTSKWICPYVETSISTTADMLLSDITKHDDITITVEETNGTTWVLNNCFFEGPKKYNPIAGKLKSKFTSLAKQPAQQIRRS